MISGILELENTVQVGDKTRLSAIKSFVTKDEAPVTKVEIEPEGGNGFIDVTGKSQDDWFLDWIYTGVSRTVTVSVRITTDGSPSTSTDTIKVVTAADDYLFSSDKDLVALEPDIMKWVPDGRSSWLNVHRAAQEKIMDWLNKSGLQDSDGKPFTKADLLDLNEVKYWSRDLTLGLIFRGISNAIGDVFDKKSEEYMRDADKGPERAKLRLDVSHDGTLDYLDDDFAYMGSRDMVRM